MSCSSSNTPSSDFQPTWEEVADAFATPNKLDPQKGTLSGCIYRSDGSKVDLSERFGGHGGDWFVSANAAQTEIPGGIRQIPGRSLYLGHLMSRHYGHFITETLSTFWIFEECGADNFDCFVFHSFWGPAPLRPYARHCLERFGIDPERIVLVDVEPMRFERLIVPERLFRINHSADLRLRHVYRRLTAPMRSTSAPDRRVYLSRRGLDTRLLRRTIANEIRVEALFRTAGFEILFPETLSFSDQLEIYSRSQILAGISGSALHNSLFLSEGCHVIELDNLHAVGHATQELCNFVAGASGHVIEFRGRIVHGPRRVMVFDLEHLRSELMKILERQGLPAPSLADGLPRLRRAEVMDIAGRILSPIARETVRRLLGRRR